VAILSRIKAAVLFGCVLFCSQVFAVDYFWGINANNYGSSPQAACDYMGAQQYATNSSQALHHTTTVMDADPTYSKCSFFFTWREGTGGTDTTTPYAGPVQWIRRYGSTCPVGTGPYDPTTGKCTVVQLQPGEKCADQTGSGGPTNPMIWDSTVSKCVRFTESEGDAPCTFLKAAGDGNPSYAGTSYSVAGTVGAGGVGVAPPTFAQDGLRCEVSTVSTSECITAVSGAVTCNVVGKFTGKASSTGALDVSDALCPNGTCPADEPETKATETPCAPVGNGSGGSTCTATKETTQEGSQQCGTVNGAVKCFTKPPYSNGVTTNISATSETLADGSIKVTTVKNSSNTVCTDVQTCTTKTSTTTTHTTTRPNGSTTTDTTCKGTCTSNGGGVETDPNAGSGNTGTGTGGGGTGGNGDGEGGGGTAGTSNDCAVPPPCDGDPFLCTVIQQAHIDTCKLMAGPTPQQEAEQAAKAAAANAALDAAQADLDAKTNTLFSQFKADTAGSAPGAAKCLPDVPFTVMGHSMDMEFSKACDSISLFRFAVLAAAYLFAARIIFREV
jgi:hypothetical protein